VALTVQRLRAEIVNPGEQSRRALVTLTLQRLDADPATVTLTFPGGAVLRVVAGPTPVTVRQPITAPPGSSVLRVETGALPVSALPGNPGVVLHLSAAVTDSLLLEGRPPAPGGPRG